jgi:predicted permease
VTLRTALRNLLKSPRLSLAAVACISLGAAATSAIATLVTATLLRPLPFPDADRLVRIWFDDGRGNARVSLSIPDVRDAASLASFDRLLGTARVRIVALLDGGAERMRGEAVTPDYFDTLGIHPLRGRLLGADDNRPDAPRVVVLSHRTWVTRFGAADVVGRPFRTSREVYTIAGVAPPGFSGSIEDDVVEFWMPLPQYEPAGVLQDRFARAAWAIGRLRPGSTLRAAQDEVAALGRRIARDFPGDDGRIALRVEPMGENWRASFRSSAWLLLAAAVLLLTVAATNVAGLMVARVIDRRRELAVRSALGASRGELVRQLLVETLLLVAAGGVVGTLAAPFVLDGFLLLSPVTLPGYLRVEPNPTALLIALAVLGLIGILAGIAPALVGSRVQPADVLREGGRGQMGGRTERRWGAWLIAAEAALTLMLLVSGGLLLRSWQRLEHTHLGYRTDGIARLAITVSRQDAGDEAALAALYQRVRTAVGQYPGVDAVGIVWPTLPPWDGYRAHVRYSGLDPSLAEIGREVGGHVTDAGVLPMLGVPIVSGRNLQAADGHGTRVALVSRALAERMGGTRNALDRELTLVPDRDAGLPSGSFRIVGVVENVAYDGLGEQDTRRYIRYGDSTDAKASREDVYLSLAAFPSRVISIGAFTRQPPGTLIDPLRRRLADLAPTSAVHWTGTMNDELAVEYAPSRFYAVLVAAFSTTALGLTAIGLFAVLSHAVARRSQEISLRVALGATRPDVVRLVLGNGLVPLAIGIALGLAGSVVLTRVMRGVLYGVSAFDAGAFAGATILLVAIALTASILPARRASALDPVGALRSE